MHTIIDTQQNSVVVRDLTAEETAQQQIDDSNDAKLRNEINQTAASKQALFAKLGIAEDEAKLLLS